MQDKIIRFTQVQLATGLSRSTIWRKERDGTFPRRRRISTNGVGWLESEVEAWVRSSAPVSSMATSGSQRGR